MTIYKQNLPCSPRPTNVPMATLIRLENLLTGKDVKNDQLEKYNLFV